MVIRKLAQSALTSGLNAVKTGIMSVEQTALPNRVIVPIWTATRHRVGSYVAEIEPVDFSMVGQDVLSVSQKFMQSFINGHLEKEERARVMFKPVLNEALRKTEEILSMSERERAVAHEQLTSALDNHKDTKKQIKNVQKFTEFIQKKLDPVLTDVLASKLDPQILDKFCKMLRTSARFTSQVVPAFRVLNNVSLVYDAVKTLYPEHVQEIENHIVNTLQAHQETLTQTILEKGHSVKERLAGYKQQNGVQQLTQEEDLSMSEKRTLRINQ